MEPQILGSYSKGSDIYVQALIADGDYFNENGICYTSSLLERWHKANIWEGKVHNAHPTGNHPLAYESEADENLAESAQVAHYIDKSVKWGFGNYIKTFLKTLGNGSKRLIGIFRIADEGAKRAWREGKFPKFVSSSAFVLNRDEKGRITDAIPISVSSVNKPAYPPHIAGVSKQCEGGHECVSQLVESSKRVHNCSQCRYTILSSFQNRYSSHSSGKVSESSMADDNPNAPNTEGEEVKDTVTTISDELTGADGKTKLSKTKGEEEIDWKSKFESLNEEHKKLKSTYKSTEETNKSYTEKFAKLEKRNLETAVRAKIDKLPLIVFDNKEENREEAIKKFVSRFGKLSEDDILSDIDDTYHLAPKMIEIQNSGNKKRVGESGLISNDGKLMMNKDKDGHIEGVSIYDATGVFGE